MNAWDLYTERMNNIGKTKRDSSFKKEVYNLKTMLPQSLSYHSVILDDVQRDVVIIDSDNLNEKMIYSLPGEDIDNGAMVKWANNMWLVTERDANAEIYTRAKMFQCNYLLKWVELNNDEPVIVEQWCVVDDGTKYMTGEYEDRNFIVTRGETRIAVTIQRNEHTLKLKRTNRFLVDDIDATNKIAFALTKPLKAGNTFDKKGVFKFVMSETNSSDYDNIELGIADYYRYFPDAYHPQNAGSNIDDITEVWL